MCQVKSIIATFNRLEITGENDCMQVPIHFIVAKFELAI